MSRTTRVDFHCHSQMSDGYFAPEVLANKLASAGVHYAALTDHDSLAGLDRFQRAATKRGVATLSGLEIAATFAEREVHLLAYGFTPSHAAIRKLLGKSLPAGEAIEAIHEAGGKAFLAHPLHPGRDGEELEAAVQGLRSMGLDGIEAYYAAYGKEQQEQLATLAERHGLLTTGGSDFHGPGMSGPARPGVDVPSAAWKQFRDAMRESARDAMTPGSVFSLDPVPAAINWNAFFLRIVLPALLAVGLFSAFLFAVLLPTLEDSLLSRKREMIRELTNSAWSILAEYEKEEREGRLTREEAQESAILRVRFLRYGSEGKDYFWISDMHPRMVMHPYREDLNGQDLTDYTDPDGVRLFVEVVNVVRQRGSGYIDYVWQWKDDQERLAPKQSYVRGFEPWGWVIGTGIYVEDVQEEVDALSGRIIDAAVVITLVIGTLLFVVAQQSLRIEHRRGEAERDLHISHERYRALVRASTEGTLMILDGRCAYANRAMLDMLGYSRDELAFLDIHDIVETPGGDASGIDAILAGEELPGPSEAILKRRDGEAVQVLLRSTRVAFAGREGVILNARDIASRKAMEEELGASREKYKTLAEGVNLGVFRANYDPPASFLEVNAAGRRILGCAGEAPLPEGLRDVLADADASQQLWRNLHAHESVKDAILQVQRTDGTLATVSLSVVLVRDEDGTPRYYDGIMEDISEDRRAESERENLIAQLQTSLLFLNEPVRNSLSKAVTCPTDMSIREAAALMTRSDFSAVVVMAAEGEVVGVVTDHDLRERVVARGQDPSRPVREIMSAPVVFVADWVPVYEAFVVMREHNTRHLVVKDGNDRVVGIVRDSELVRLDRYSAILLTREIQRASSIEELTRSRARLATLVGALVSSGALPRNISRTITAVSDTIVERIIELVVEEMGAPPARFAFVALGSEGREEQTLSSDQDNVLIYEDPPEAEARAAADYFLGLGRKVCEALDRTGCPYCKGDTMASNPEWNQPLSGWKRTFTRWITEPDSEQLLRFSIHFDFRRVYGEATLTSDLRRHIHVVLGNQPAFFLHLARNTLRYKAPIGRFGQIITGASGADPDTLDLKAATLPIVNFARLYALQNRIEETNTVERINQLHARHVLHDDTYRELCGAYQCLLQLRYKHQMLALREGRAAGNSVNLKSLTQIEVGMLEQALSQFAVIQKKVGFDFMGGNVQG